MKKDKRLLVKYYRLSLEDKDMGESNSIINQRKLIEDYVAGKAYLRDRISLELVDDGYTGTNFNRPGIKKFFELLKKDRIACLVVKDFSRFTRDYIELGNYVEQIFPFMEVRFISINDGYDSAVQSNESSLEVPFKGILNDLYSKDISMKVKAAKGQLIKEGRLCSGSYPFGYRKVGKEEYRQDKMPYQVDEEAAEVVRLIFKLALEGKKNIEIARILNQKGCFTPGMVKRKNGDFGYGLKDGHVSIWDSTKVLKILRDERYMGTLIVGRYRGMGVGSGKMEEKPEHMWVRRENGIPAIIPKKDFERVQEIKPIQKRGKYGKKHHILYRKIRCGCCGRFLYFKPSNSGEQYNSFFCKQPHLKSDSRCFCGYIKEKEILELLLKVINIQVKLAEKIKEETRKNSGENSRRNEEESEEERLELYLKRLKKEITLKKKEKAQDYCKYKRGECTREKFIEKKASLQKAVEQCEQEMERAYKTREKLEADRREVAESYSEYDEIQQLDRGMVEKWVEMIWVYDLRRIKIELKYGKKVIG